MSWRSSTDRAAGSGYRIGALWAGLLLYPLLLAAAPEESAARGPLSLRSQNPLFLMFYRPSPTRATVPAAGDGRLSLTSDYSSFFLADESRDGANAAIFDGELWRNTLRATVGLGGRLAVTVEIPMLYGGGGGFLDHLIEEYHGTFGFNQGGRDKNPDNRFLFALGTDRGIVFRLPENELELGDVAATIGWLAAEETERRPAVLLRAGVELPTGDEAIGYGNGDTDFGVGIVAEKAVGRYRVYAAAGYQWLAEPLRFKLTGARIDDSFSADLAAERPVGRQVVLIGQIGYETSPMRNLGLPNVDTDSLTLALAVSWSVSPRWALDFAFQEDLDSESSQDLTGHFGVGWRF